MFEIKNLRLEKKNGWSYLICDFEVNEISSPFSDTELWVAVEEDNDDMLTDKVYDPFVLVPLMLGMYYKQDVHICGNISPRLYHNVTHYIQAIFDKFSRRTSLVKFSVDGFDTVDGPKNLIGTGISCGVDSLVTIYDNFVKEDDINFKINSLFFFNCGTHGDFDDPATYKKFMDRVTLNTKCAVELGLPVYIVNTNFHVFTHTIGEQTIGYLAIYSCILSMQRYIKRYMTSGNLSYDEIMDNRINSMDFDFAEFCESYFPHLVSTEGFELVIDGCQYTRSEKIERISDWVIAQKYLNVCITPINDGHNCSNCEKCMWTLISLEANGTIDKFSAVFDLTVYKQKSWKWKNKFMSRHGKDSMETSVMDYFISKGGDAPSVLAAKIYMFCRRIVGKMVRMLKMRN